MAALMRLASRRCLQRCLNPSLIYEPNRAIKTSPKKEDTAITTLGSPSSPTAPIPPVTKEDFANPKNWVSFGYDYKSKTEDRHVTHLTMFVSVTLCLVWGTFVWSYLPDPSLRDWAQREGFLELRRREAAGVDLVNPNYIEPSQMILPSDEELGDTEIII